MLHKKTTLYRRSMELIRLCADVSSRLPRGHGYLTEQMRRSSSSVAQNYAEGSGKLTTAERRRYFRIAKGSAFETAASLDIAFNLGLIDESTNQRAQDICDHLGALLHRAR